jgi:CrcB protein
MREERLWADVHPPGHDELDHVGLHDRRRHAVSRPSQWDILLAVAAGGVVGSEARYGLGELVPHAGRQFPWSTLVINASGCLLIGALMALLPGLTSSHRLARPFVGVGVLGGYTTFSTFAVDVERLVREHRPLSALEYTATTVVVCSAAVWLSTGLTLVVGRAVISARIRRHVEKSSR